MDEEDRLRESLATLYRNGRERMAGLDDAKQREFIESRFAQGDLCRVARCKQAARYGLRSVERR